MARKKLPEEPETEAEKKMLKKTGDREKKKQKKMPVTGKGVFKLKQLKDKSEE